jgi:thymidylate synthase ThyX
MSVSDTDILITYVLRYPRFIHSEFMTYRMLSRNAASSRAIPAKKMRESVIADPAMPVEWGANTKGMSAIQHLDPKSAKDAQVLWLKARDSAVRIHEELEESGVHKQILNRIIEPWLHIDVVATGNREAFKHLFRERIHASAQPEFKALATWMQQAYLRALWDNIYQPLDEGQWHLPFLSEDEIADSRMQPHLQEIDRAVSSARCARVSYNGHETKRPLDEDLALCKRLAVREQGDSEPMHLSPLEHVAMACPGQWANFRGFKSFRQVREGK